MPRSETAYNAAIDDAHPFIRPGWSALNIALMVIGFVVFWPLGLAMLAYMVWGHKLDDLKKDLKEQFSHQLTWPSENRNQREASSGNAAFDDYRAKELERLEKERARLNEMSKDFDAYMENLRKARDKKEFDRFMSDRKKTSTDE